MFSGELDRGAFGWHVVLRALLCLIIAPLVLVLAILGFASCAKDTSACFMGSILLGMFSAHIVYLLFAMSCFGPIIRRLRRLQLPIWLVALPILFFLADVQSGASFIHSLVTRFTLPGGSSLAGSFYVPRHFLLALVFMLALWILPDRERTEQSLCQRWGILGLMTFGMLVFMTIGATMELIRTASLLLLSIKGYQAVAEFLRYYYLYNGNTVVLVVMVVLTARWQRQVSSNTQSEITAHRSDAPSSMR